MFRSNFGYSVEKCEKMIAELKAKDSSNLFDDIYVTHFTDFCRLAQRKGVPEHAAEDCAVEGILHLKLRLSAGRFSFEQANADLKNWSIIVYDHFAISYARKLLKVPSLPNSNSEDNLFRSMMEDADTEWKESLHIAFEQAFKVLCTECRNILNWRYWDGLSSREIGIVLDGVLDKTVDKKMERCKIKLREGIGKLHEIYYKPKEKPRKAKQIVK